MGWLYNFTGILEVADKLVKGNFQDIKLMIVGDGDIYTSLENLIVNTKTDKIILTGKRPYCEIPELLSMADVCILPAYNNDVMNDIVPIKIYEYLASGKPVICSKLKGILTEFGYDSGILYSTSVNELFDFVLKLKNDTKLRANLSLKSILTVKSQEWDNITVQFENILTKFIYNI